MVGALDSMGETPTTCQTKVAVGGCANAAGATEQLAASSVCTGHMAARYKISGGARWAATWMIDAVLLRLLVQILLASPGPCSSCLAPDAQVLQKLPGGGSKATTSAFQRRHTSREQGRCCF